MTTERDMVDTEMVEEEDSSETLKEEISENREEEEIVLET